MEQKRFFIGRRTNGRADGVITVFFALLSTIFIGFLFVLLESVRFEGARMQAANLTELGNFSVFAEYESKLLSEFDVFAVDAARGTGDYRIERIRELLQSYLQKNTDVRQEISEVSALCFDPWQIQLKDCRVNGYTLLTDDRGEPFYQQAVAFMHDTAVTGAAGKLLGWYRDAKDAAKKQEDYEKNSKVSDLQMQQLETQTKDQQEQALENLDGEDTERAIVLRQEEAERNAKNPLAALWKLGRRDLLSVVCPGAVISGSSVNAGALYSKRRNNHTGNKKGRHRYGSLLDDLFFREYLLDHFRCYRSESNKEPSGKGGLSYELEYILCGKLNDRKNLKATASKLLVLREGCNYASCMDAPSMQAEAEGLAIVLVGWTGLPALIAVMKHALLLGWSFAESMLDVKTLMDGGSVPLMKTPESWQVSFDQLIFIEDLLKTDASGTQTGMSYQGYLRLLLNMQSIRQQKQRGLDLIELRMKNEPGLAEFRVDNCVTEMTDIAAWEIPPLFSRVTGVFLQLSGAAASVEVSGGYAYLG